MLKLEILGGSGATKWHPEHPYLIVFTALWNGTTPSLPYFCDELGSKNPVLDFIPYLLFSPFVKMKTGLFLR